MWVWPKQPYVSAKDKNAWISKADEFNERTNFPNCIGALDGKHIRMRKPNVIGFQFSLFKNFSFFAADEVYGFISVRGGTVKSLARPGRKQATATKLGICSTYSSRNSIHFLPVYLTFASHSNKIQNVVSAAAMTSALDEK